ncbi:hypothetical protein Fot_10944 [Forsythia ovata]|uniref:Uncharacterized protein n=1 Tax=Forsythia ovata TaxID=205694 RepID=A0ABD1WIA6_9LAMI
MRGTNNQPPVGSTNNSVQMVDNSAKNLSDDFAKSIADGLNEVSRLCVTKQSPRSKMASSYKKSYATNMKVMRVTAMNTASQHPGSSLKGRVMRPRKAKTTGEAKCPSFDLGIVSQSNVP